VQAALEGVGEWQRVAAAALESNPTVLTLVNLHHKSCALGVDVGALGARLLNVVWGMRATALAAQGSEAVEEIRGLLYEAERFGVGDPADLEKTRVLVDELTPRYCLCRKPDDGTFMIECDGCHEWFHGPCVGLTNKVAKSLTSYICPPCAAKRLTGDTSMLEAPGDSEPVKKGRGRKKRPPPTPMQRVCTVCFDATREGAGDLLTCGKCGVAVHAVCYTTEPPAAGTVWKCDPCSQDIPMPPCELCPVMSGGLKPTGDGKWAHVACATWIPEAVASTGLVDGLADILPDRFRLTCTVCKTKGGACIQCDYGRCTTSYHPMCALIQGFTMRTMSAESAPTESPRKQRDSSPSKQQSCAPSPTKSCAAPSPAPPVPPVSPVKNAPPRSCLGIGSLIDAAASGEVTAAPQPSSTPQAPPPSASLNSSPSVKTDAQPGTSTDVSSATPATSETPQSTGCTAAGAPAAPPSTEGHKLTDTAVDALGEDADMTSTSNSTSNSNDVSSKKRESVRVSYCPKHTPTDGSVNVSGAQTPDAVKGKPKDAKAKESKPAEKDKDKGKKKDKVDAKADKGKPTETKTAAKTKQTYCFCLGQDDGELMVECEECTEWFHGQCLGLDPDAQVEEGWVCPNCCIELFGDEPEPEPEPAPAVEQRRLPTMMEMQQHHHHLQQQSSEAQGHSMMQFIHQMQVLQASGMYHPAMLQQHHPPAGVDHHPK